MRPDFPVMLRFSGEIAKEDVVLELGANVGGNSKELPKYAKFVHSFEPTPNCYKWLLRNTKKIPNIRCYNAAVSDKTVRSRPFSMQYGSGSLFDQGWKTATSSVNVIGINDLPFGFNVMLMDCEGAEVPIFEEFEKFDMVDKIYVETHTIGGNSTLPRVKEILMKHYGTVWQDVDPSGLYPWLIAKCPK